MFDVVACGEIIIDFSQERINDGGYPTLTANPGGAPCNYLAPLAKYGAKTALIGKVGKDSFGKLMINTLKNIGVNTKGVIQDEKVFTTLAFVTNDENGDRNFSFARKPGADTCLKFNEVDLSLIDKTKVFHFGTLSLTNNPSKATTKKLVAYAKKKKKIISFDPNLRKNLWENLNDAKTEMKYGLQNADIVKMSDYEAKFLFNVKADKATSYLLKKYPNIKLLYVTCGENGVYYATRKYSGHIDSLKGIKAIDTTGAGDIFGGSAMYKFLIKKKDIDNLSNDDLFDMVSFANKVAGLSTTKHGGVSSVPEITKEV